MASHLSLRNNSKNVSAMARAALMTRQATQAWLRGQHREAEATLRRVIRQTPGYRQAYLELISVLHLLKRQDKLEEILAQALRANPDWVEVVLAQGNFHFENRRFARAETAYRRATELDPGHALAHNNLGRTLAEVRDHRTAILSFCKALDLDPKMATAWNNLGTSMKAMQDLDGAEQCFQQVLQLEPDNAIAHYNVGNVMLAREQLEEAQEWFEKAARLEPGHPEIHSNLGVTLERMGCIETSIEHHQRAIHSNLASPEIHRNFAMALLALGRDKEGWEHLEYRWQLPEYARIAAEMPGIRWHGEPIAGKTILLHYEQGFGDTIQFLRFVPLVEELGARVILGLQPKLLELAGTLQGNFRLMTRAQAVALAAPRRQRKDGLARSTAGAAAVTDGTMEESAGAPTLEQQGETIDWFCPLMSLPGVLGVSLEHAPPTPYLYPSPDGVARARAELEAEGLPEGLRVGVVWSGNPKFLRDKQRSLPFSIIAGLAQIPGVCLIALQLGPAAEECKESGLHAPLEPEDGFLRTAEIIAGLDLVISVDTAVAHLAGALNVPVWVMLPLPADWRWQTVREDSPWYSSARLFRQPARGDWPAVGARIADELKKMLELRRHNGREATTAHKD